MTDLEVALRCVGFAVAVLGTCAAVPAAFWRMVARAVIAVNRLLGRHSAATVQLTAAAVSASAGWATLQVRHLTDGTLEERLARVEQRLTALDDQQQQIAERLQQEIVDRTGADRKLQEHLDAEVARLDRALVEQQQFAEEVDARALPIVLGGAFLSTFPELLGASVVIGTLALCVGLGLFFRAWALLDGARPEPE